jgi:hypothetical protein
MAQSQMPARTVTTPAPIMMGANLLLRRACMNGPAPGPASLAEGVMNQPRSITEPAQKPPATM